MNVIIVFMVLMLCYLFLWFIGVIVEWDDWLFFCFRNVYGILVLFKLFVRKEVCKLDLV